MDNAKIVLVVTGPKGENRDLLKFPRCAATLFQHERSHCYGAITCKSRATHRALIT